VVEVDFCSDLLVDCFLCPFALFLLSGDDYFVLLRIFLSLLSPEILFALSSCGLEAEICICLFALLLPERLAISRPWVGEVRVRRENEEGRPSLTEFLRFHRAFRFNKSLDGKPNEVPYCHPVMKVNGRGQGGHEAT
jgi:hypothetical protein